MKRFHFAALLAGVACLGNTGAQASSLQVWGVVDNFVHLARTGQGTQTALASSGRRGSKFGLRGNEDLGHGTQAYFELESGLRTDTGCNSSPFSGYLFDGQALIGVRGPFGQLSLGRQYIPHWGALAMVDPTEMSMGSAINYFGLPFGNGALNSNNNTLMYLAPMRAGWLAAFSVSLGEGGERLDNFLLPPGEAAEREENLYNVALTYMAGPALFNLSYAQQETNEKRGNIDRYYVVSGTYDFGPVKPSVIYVKRTGSQADQFSQYGNSFVDVDAYQLGVTVPAFGGAFIAVAGALRNHTNKSADAKAWGLKYEYPLSRRTTAYGGVTGLDNDSEATFNISPASPSQGFTDPATGLGLRGASAQSLYFGLSHQF